MPVNGGTSFTLLCSIHTGGADHRGGATQLSNTLGLDAPVADGFLVFASLSHRAFDPPDSRPLSVIKSGCACKNSKLAVGISCVAVLFDQEFCYQ